MKMNFVIKNNSMKILFLIMILTLALSCSACGGSSDSSGSSGSSSSSGSKDKKNDYETPISIEDLEVIVAENIDYPGMGNSYINNSDYTIELFSIDMVPKDDVTIADFEKLVTFESKKPEDIVMDDVKMSVYVNDTVAPGATSKINVQMYFEYGDDMWEDNMYLPNIDVYNLFKPVSASIFYVAEDGLAYLIDYNYEKEDYSLRWEEGRDPADI